MTALGYARIVDTMVTMFSYQDALHDHLSIGNREGCIACAQTQADMALSKRAYHASLAAKSAPGVAETASQLAHVA